MFTTTVLKFARESQFSLSLLLLSAIPSLCASTRTLSIPSSVPSDASDIIDRSFPGFAFEQASFYNFAFDGYGNPNTFSQNLINSVLSRTGGTPILRVGGTSGDLARYNASQPYPIDHPATEGGPVWSPPYLTVGPSYFKTFSNFPNASYVFMVPFLHLDLENTVEWACQGLESIGDRLQAIEIGNEPDIYHWFNVPTYVDKFVRFQKELYTQFHDLVSTRPIFQALDTANGGARRLAVSAALRAGINSTGSVSQVAYHLYQVVDVPGAGLEWLQRKVANHTAVVKAMSVFVPHIQHLREHAPGVPFILSEVGNSLGNQQDITQRNVLATALWNVDYQLHGMAIGVTRVNNQQIVYPGYQMWEPVVSDFGPPLVRANYYSQPLVAEFIRPSGVTQVSELTVEDTHLLSAYVAYEDSRPARIAIVNLELWTPANGTRGSVDVILFGFSSEIMAAEVYRLTAPSGAFANDTLTWRGLQWTYERNGLEARVGKDSERVYVRDGELIVTVEATSAVIVDLETDWSPSLHEDL